MLPLSPPRSRCGAAATVASFAPGDAALSQTWTAGPLDVRNDDSRTRVPWPGTLMSCATPVVLCSPLRNRPSPMIRLAGVAGVALARPPGVVDDAVASGNGSASLTVWL